MTGKDELRRIMRERRRALDDEAQALASWAVCKRVLGFAPYADARCVMAYIACRGELSLEPVLRDVLSGGKTLLLPRCEAPGMMTARRVTDAAQLVSGRFGLMEPSSACEIAPPQEIDLILVPGTAFDRAGGRLGQGGGYYDRFFRNTRAVRAGICHEFALLDAVPQEKHDAAMDAVITPGSVVWIGDGRRI